MNSPHPISSLWQSPYSIQICPPHKTRSSQNQTRPLHVLCSLWILPLTPSLSPNPNQPSLQFLTELIPTFVPTRRILPTKTNQETAQDIHRQAMPFQCLQLYEIPHPCPLINLSPLWLLPLQPGITSYLLSMPVPMRYQMHYVESKYNLAHFSLKLINYACTSLIMYKPDTKLVVPYHTKGSCQVSTPAGKYFYWKSGFYGRNSLIMHESH